MALTDNLIAFWELEETTGTRVDAHGSNDLAENNGVGSETGKVGTCSLHVAANNEYLNLADNTDLSSGDIDFSVQAWVWADSEHAGGIVTKKTEYRLTWNGLDFYWVFNNKLVQSGFNSLSLDTWYHFIGTHDATGNTVELFRDASSVDSDTDLGGSDSANDFIIGAHDSTTWPFDGRADQVGIWKKVLSASEITELHNSGNGLSYAAMLSAAGVPSRTLLGVGI